VVARTDDGQKGTEMELSICTFTAFERESKRIKGFYGLVRSNGSPLTDKSGQQYLNFASKRAAQKKADAIIGAK
jgi:hypothetical protein